MLSFPCVAFPMFIATNCSWSFIGVVYVYCIILYYVILYRIILYYIVLYYIVLYYIILYHIIILYHNTVVLQLPTVFSTVT